MKLSVVVTTYNRPDALVKVLNGLGVQTHPPHEVIIADDGSTHETKDAVSALTGGFVFPVQHVWQEDKGFRAARIRNRAILSSKGEYIVLMDGDCIPQRHFIQDHLQLAEKGFFYQGKRVLVHKKATTGFTCRDANTFLRLAGLAIKGKLANLHHMVRLPLWPAGVSMSMSGAKTCNMGVFRSDLFAVNGFNETFVGWGREDSELVARFYKSGLKRKTHPFMAACFHLWHRENSRDRLKLNDEMLDSVMASDDFFTLNGLVKKDE